MSSLAEVSIPPGPTRARRRAANLESGASTGLVACCGIIGEITLPKRTGRHPSLVSGGERISTQEIHRQAHQQQGRAGDPQAQVRRASATATQLGPGPVFRAEQLVAVGTNVLGDAPAQ